MAWLEIKVTDLVWMFVDNALSFRVRKLLLILGMIIYELACAHFEDFHGIEKRTRSFKALEIEKTLSIDEVILIEILRVEFFIDLHEVKWSGWEFGFWIIFLSVVPVKRLLDGIVCVLDFQERLNGVSFLVDVLGRVHWIREGRVISLLIILFN